MLTQQDHIITTPIVTFIVPCYNVPADMLQQCLDSIMALSLTADEREVIVIDDGSDVSPIEQLAKYGDDIIYIRQPNGGLSKARNAGLRMASGQYIQFVDADDYLIKASYERCLDIVRKQQPDVVMFGFALPSAPPPASSSTHDSPNTDMKSGVEYLSHHNLHASACCYIFSRSILGTLRFTPGIYHEDEEFTPLLLLRAERIISTDAPAYFYRQRPQSITTDTNMRQTVKRLNDSLCVIERLNSLRDTLPPDERHALQRRIAQLTMDYIYNIITQTHNRHYLDRKLAALRKKGLFPLPDRDYTTKYKWFRRLTANSLGLTLLMNALPLMKKEQ